MGSEAATAPDPVFAPVTDPAGLATWDGLVVASSTSILQTSWWNAPLARLGVASDVHVQTDGPTARAGLLVRSARLPLVPLTIGTCIAGPLAPDWTPALAAPVVDALEDVTQSRRSLELTLVCPGGSTLADDVADELRRRGHPVHRAPVPPRAVVALAGRTEDDVLASCSRKHRYSMRRAESGPVELGAVTDAADLTGSYAALAATAARKGFNHLRPWSALRPSVEAGIERGACEVFAARHEGRVVAAVLVGHTARATEVLYAGFLDEAAPFRVNQALHLHAIRSALARGSAAYDMGQLERADDPTDMDHFKLRFGAEIHADPDTVTWSVRPRTAEAIGHLRRASWARRPVSWVRSTVVRQRGSGGEHA